MAAAFSGPRRNAGDRKSRSPSSGKAQAPAYKNLIPAPGSRPPQRFSLGDLAGYNNVDHSMPWNHCSIASDDRNAKATGEGRETLVEPLYPCSLGAGFERANEISTYFGASSHSSDVA